MGKRGEITGYNTDHSIDEIYQRKLEALCAKIRAVTYYGTVYTTSQQYGCKFCKCRIMVRGNERICCLGCQEVPFWSQETRQSVATIMVQYPTLQECQEASRPHRDMTTHITTEKVAYGSRVEEARLARGLTREYLAARIVKKQGGTISTSTISGIERGMQSPSPYVREQLERILGLENVVCMEA